MLGLVVAMLIVCLGWLWPQVIECLWLWPDVIAWRDAGEFIYLSTGANELFAIGFILFGFVTRGRPAGFAAQGWCATFLQSRRAALTCRL
jgi:hypothetical protein